MLLNVSISGEKIRNLLHIMYGISKFPIRNEAKIDIRSIVHEMSWIYRTGSFIVISQVIVFVEVILRRTKLLIV